MIETRAGDCSSMSDRATRTVSVADVTTSTSVSLIGRRSPWSTRPDFRATIVEA